MDWVHCNHCFVQPGDVEMKKFFITNCGHIFCDECLKMNQSKECQMCHIKYTTILLTSNMKSEVEAFFRDPIIDLKKQIKILEFQQSQRLRFVSHMREKIKAYITLKKENYNLNEELVLFKQENITLRDENRKLKDLLLHKKKNEFPSKSDQELNSQTFSTPRMHCYNQFLAKDLQYVTPKSKSTSSGNERFVEPNFRGTTKRTFTPDVFVMSDSKSLEKYNKISSQVFTTPELPKFSGPYRSNKVSTPDTNTPPTPDSAYRDYGQRDPLQRKVKLPNSKNGPSPATKMGFHGLSLSRQTSTPNKDTINTNKYFKYFK